METPKPPIRFALDRGWRWVLLVAAAALAAYFPALRGGLVWDDDAHVTKASLRSLHGLWRIWFDLGATQQYYPVLHSAFWFEHRLWGEATLGYHLVNLALHVTAACLFAVALQRLWGREGRRETAAWIAALLFALHPICVESVAWISEQKNTLSAVFYLLAGLTYLKWDGTRQGGPRPPGERYPTYIAATLFFLLALFTKSVTCTLPAALLLILWWKRGRLVPRRDVLPLVPWFVVGIASGLFTAWVESHYGGARGADFALGAASRLALAGRVICFYLGKLLWPANLIFIYPHWQIDAHRGGQDLYLCAVAAALAVLWRRRNRVPGALVAVLFFIGTLFPALGFFNVFPFIYSYVADHFQYLASLGIFALAGYLLSRIPLAVSGALLALLGLLSWRQCHEYRDAVTLYEATLRKNPQCWMAHNNLGKINFEAGRVPQAVAHYQTALRLNPANALNHYDYGVVLYDLHRYPEAIAQLEESVRLGPDSAEKRFTLSNALADAGRRREALASFEQTVSLNPKFAEAYVDWGNLLAKEGRVPEAIDKYQRAVRLRPEDPLTIVDLAISLARMGRTPEAIRQFRLALRYQPNSASIRYNYGNALMAAGDTDGALVQFREAVRLKPDYADARVNLGISLLHAGHRDEALAEFERAVRTDPANPSAHLNYGVALASRHRMSEAIGEFRASARLGPDNPEAHALLADALIEQGDMSGARAQYEEAEKLRGRTPPGGAN